MVSINKFLSGIITCILLSASCSYAIDNHSAESISLLVKDLKFTDEHLKFHLALIIPITEELKKLCEEYGALTRKSLAIKAAVLGAGSKRNQRKKECRRECRNLILKLEDEYYDLREQQIANGIRKIAMIDCAMSVIKNLMIAHGNRPYLKQLLKKYSKVHEDVLENYHEDKLSVSL